MTVGPSLDVLMNPLILTFCWLCEFLTGRLSSLLATVHVASSRQGDAVENPIARVRALGRLTIQAKPASHPRMGYRKMDQDCRTRFGFLAGDEAPTARRCAFQFPDKPLLPAPFAGTPFWDGH